MMRQEVPGLPGTCPGEARALLAGLRSLPLRGVDDPREHGLVGEGPGYCGGFSKWVAGWPNG
jgi:hypothetical protein